MKINSHLNKYYFTVNNRDLKSIEDYEEVSTFIKLYINANGLEKNIEPLELKQMLDEINKTKLHFIFNGENKQSHLLDISYIGKGDFKFYFKQYHLTHLSLLKNK